MKKQRKYILFMILTFVISFFVSNKNVLAASECTYFNGNLTIEYDEIEKKLVYSIKEAPGCGKSRNDVCYNIQVHEVEGTGLKKRLDQKEWKFLDSNQNIMCLNIYYVKTEYFNDEPYTVTYDVYPKNLPGKTSEIQADNNSTVPSNGTNNGNNSTNNSINNSTNNSINNGTNNSSNNATNGSSNSDNNNDKCQEILTEEMIDILNRAIKYIRIIAPILLIIFGIVDFGKAVLSDDKDELKKATSKFTKRAIIVVAIFFVPLIVGFLIDAFNSVSEKSITDLINCGIK